MTIWHDKTYSAYRLSKISSPQITTWHLTKICAQELAIWTPTNPLTKSVKRQNTTMGSLGFETNPACTLHRRWINQDPVYVYVNRMDQHFLAFCTLHVEPKCYISYIEISIFQSKIDCNVVCTNKKFHCEHICELLVIPQAIDNDKSYQIFMCNC